KIRGNEGEVLTRNPVSLRRVAVTTVRECPLPHSARDHDDIAADLFPKVFLKDTSIVDLHAFDHIFPPSRLQVCSMANRPRGRSASSGSRLPIFPSLTTRRSAQLARYGNALPPALSPHRVFIWRRGWPGGNRLKPDAG